MSKLLSSDFHIRDDFPAGAPVCAVGPTWYNAVAKFLNDLEGTDGVDLMKILGGRSKISLDWEFILDVLDKARNLAVLVRDPPSSGHTLPEKVIGFEENATKATLMDPPEGGGTPSDQNPKASQRSASPGTSEEYSRGDHVHPVCKAVTDAAAAADAAATAAAQAMSRATAASTAATEAQAQASEAYDLANSNASRIGICESNIENHWASIQEILGSITTITGNVSVLSTQVDTLSSAVENLIEVEIARIDTEMQQLQTDVQQAQTDATKAGEDAAEAKTSATEAKTTADGVDERVTVIEGEYLTETEADAKYVHGAGTTVIGGPISWNGSTITQPIYRLSVSNGQLSLVSAGQQVQINTVTYNP